MWAFQVLFSYNQLLGIADVASNAFGIFRAYFSDSYICFATVTNYIFVFLVLSIPLAICFFANYLGFYTHFISPVLCFSDKEEQSGFLISTHLN